MADSRLTRREALAGGAALVVLGARLPSVQAGAWTARRLSKNPLISPDSHPSIGTNINGPSVIRVPDWIGNPLGRYYLYFADHNGTYIRLAYADRVEGPWKVHVPGTLHLRDSHFTDHIASPDAQVDPARRQIRLYYHGRDKGGAAQDTRVATSTDGLQFAAAVEPVGKGSAYWRVFQQGGWWYALAMPGRLWRSKDGLTPFEAGPSLFPSSPTQVHNAVIVDGDTLHVLYTRAGDQPERIFASRIAMSRDWKEWTAVGCEEVLRPETSWEGADLPPSPARIGAVEERICALRDPAILQDQGKTWLFYAIAGESGIAAAELIRRES